MNSALGIYSSLSVNIPDFTVSSSYSSYVAKLTGHDSVMRKTRKRKQSHLRRELTHEMSDSQYVQPLIIPVAFVLCSFAGIAVTSAGIQLYGEVLWDPLLLIDKWDNRAAAFFASFAFALTTIGTNISANSLGAGNDMTVLLPKVSHHVHVGRRWLTSFIVYQYQTRTNNLCLHWRLGPVPFGDPCQVRLPISKGSSNRLFHGTAPKGF